MRNDEVLYDRDQAFGGAQLTQLIVRQYGFSPEEAERRSAAATCPTTTRRRCSSPFVDSMAQEIGRALQFFFTSTPHNRVDYVMLAGGSAALPGLKDRVTSSTGFASMVVNPFEDMQLGAAVRERSCAARRPRTSPPAAWPCGGSCSDPDQPASAPRGAARKRSARSLLRRPGRRPPSPACAIAGRLVLWSSQQQIASQQERNAFLQTRDHASSTARSRTSPPCRRRSPRCGRASRRSKTCRPTATCRCTCSTNWSGSCPTACTSPASSRTTRSSPSPAWRSPTSGSPSCCATPAYSSDGWSSPELVEIMAATVVSANRDQQRLFDFTMRLKVKRPQDAPAAAVAGGGASRRRRARRPRLDRRRRRRPEPWPPRPRPQRRPELGLRGRGLAVPRAEPERARPVAAAARRR